jgi:hypothetical protein
MNGSEDGDKYKAGKWKNIPATEAEDENPRRNAAPL